MHNKFLVQVHPYEMALFEDERDKCHPLNRPPLGMGLFQNILQSSSWALLSPPAVNKFLSHSCDEKDKTKIRKIQGMFFIARQMESYFKLE